MRSLTDENFRLKSFARTSYKGIKKKKSAMIECIYSPHSNLNKYLFIDAGIGLNSELFTSYKEIWLEIGYGNGEHLLKNARLNPDSLIIGSEPYINGALQVITQLEANDIRNVKVWIGDVLNLLPLLPNELLTNIHVICPDPWPKRKQHKRRLIQVDFLKKLCEKLKQNGCITIATDERSYALWIENICSALGDEMLVAKSRYTSLDECVLNGFDTKYVRKAFAKHSSAEPAVLCAFEIRKKNANAIASANVC